ncbi:LamG-like jellyroll fold domain-containing protein [Achromobacter sp. MFA1 R4]|uniref:LamG-like jellyroll fold domain-containing protein n=1 Tax=Achromobacter sp. MFA1 R4 TaxID=1881016 RepID=UPI000953871A|nr:LamG-like jellyroll fold domain-containing protein [Achromobacter sp. MFA1 R4]SIT14638.1 Calcineurin-like phosphoesterase [Achromobacter sp. MFA1 R4]
MAHDKQDKQDGKLDIANTPSTLPAATDPRRRSLLKAGFGATLLPVSGSLLLSACSSDDDDDTSTPETPGQQPQPQPEPQPQPVNISSFAVAVLPDTQFYSRYATDAENQQFMRKYGSEPYKAQTQWVADHAKSLSIPFLAHLGDVVDQQGKPDQWKVADAAMAILEDAKVPYSILAGNHDVILDRDYVDASSQASATDAQRNLAAEPYLQTFSADRAKQQATFGGRDPSGFHEYHVFEAEGQKFMVLSLSWRISDDALTWANQVIRANPSLPVILVNHQLLNIDKDGVTPLEVPYGLMLWDKLIRDNDQIFMTLNGHYHGAAHLTKTNAFGNAVEEMVVDYQMAYQGGNGLMRLYEFDLTNNEIRVLSFSPWVPQKPKETLNTFDQAILTAANEQFTIKMDFAKRFGGFNKEFKAATPSHTALIDQARALILANYTDPVAAEQKPAADSEDYPQVSGTLAHWRFFGGADGQPVPVGELIADRTGMNPMRRAPLNIDGVAGAQLGDVVWSDDHHYLSAAPGSVRFLNTDKNTARMSYFATDAAAVINGQTAPNGYTVEAFIKIDRDWVASKHAWMNIMTRDGKRGDLPGFSGGDPESPPLLFAVSSLREIQWEVVPDTAGTRGAKANWSGEIIPDKWMHVAVVNDDTTHETILYVEGAPVLRNTSDAPGLATLAANMPWIIGAGSWDGARADGFFGSIGEVRIVDRALQPIDWLTARKR